MNPPTKQSVIMRILSGGLMGVAGEVARIRWALHFDTGTELQGHLDRIAKECTMIAIEAENEAARLEYQATLPTTPSAQDTKEGTDGT